MLAALHGQATYDVEVVASPDKLVRGLCECVLLPGRTVFSVGNFQPYFRDFLRITGTTTYCTYQCFGSGSGWIRIQIAMLDPDPDTDSEIEL